MRETPPATAISLGRLIQPRPTLMSFRKTRVIKTVIKIPSLRFISFVSPYKNVMKTIAAE
jgi:hypothetical protein